MLETLLINTFMPKYTTGMFVLVTNIIASVGQSEINMQIKDDYQTLQDCESAITRFQDTTQLSYILQDTSNLKFVMTCEAKGQNV